MELIELRQFEHDHKSAKSRYDFDILRETNEYVMKYGLCYSDARECAIKNHAWKQELAII